MYKIKHFSKMIPSWFLMPLGIISALLVFYNDVLYIEILTCLITIVVIILQYFQSQTYIYEITLAKWFDRGNGEFGLTIPEFLHAKGEAPQITVYEKQPSGRLSVVECDIENSEGGDVIIIANQAINGQVRIK